MQMRLSAPVVVQMFLTNLCNLRCRHCFAEAFLEAAPELSTAEWKTLIARLRKVGVFKADFSGGEIFTRADALEILEFAMGQGFASMSLTTNGTLLTPEIAAALKRCGFSTVMVSLDGDGEVNDAIRGVPGAFAAALCGLEMLLYAGIRPTVQLVLMRENFRSVPALAAALQPLRVETLTLTELLPQGRALPRFDELRLTADEHRALAETVAALRQRGKRPHIAYEPPPYASFPTRTAPRKPTPQLMKSCSAAATSCAITATGWVLPCSVFPEFKAGNVRSRDIVDVWADAPALERLRALEDTPIDRAPMCRECPYTCFCGGGCRGQAYAVFRDLMAPDPVCPHWKLRRTAGVCQPSSGDFVKWPLNTQPSHDNHGPI